MHCLDVSDDGLIYNVRSKQREKRKKEEMSCVLQNMWWEWSIEKKKDGRYKEASFKSHPSLGGYEIFVISPPKSVKPCAAVMKSCFAYPCL